MKTIELVDTVRLSLGTAIKLGLETGPKMDFFTTAFIMTNSENGCIANCAFCPQARTSKSSPELLSRIGWPTFAFEQVLNKLDLGNTFERVKPEW